ncbi:rod-binding protein [Sphingomonas morindae]|uniref:Rod-binding protein n=1 Tax=Sphingomonas morindae TaxID=1541170 RepID=A0ABY4XA47_9SPHN|nr:rod-binding protein [Sphingomonas morindae]USI73743.1 rod-binding protein [Sphingomonas morindae]
MIQPLSPLAATTGTTGTTGTAATGQNAKLKSAAQAFEAVFLRQMIGSMRQAQLADGAMDSSATDQFRDMADSRTADSMSTKGVLGIAKMLESQLSALPQVKAATAAADTAGRAVHVVGDLAKRFAL